MTSVTEFLQSCKAVFTVCLSSLPGCIRSHVCHSLSSEEIPGHMTGSLLQSLVLVKLRGF